MMHCECLDKIRNNGAIVGIKLRDLQTGQERTVNKDKLKALMTSRAIIVTNLKIDDAGRLVDRDTNDYQDELNRLRNNRKINTNTDDMTNKELLEHIKNIEAQGNSDIAKALSSIYKRQAKLEDLIKESSSKPTSARRDREIFKNLEDIKNKLYQTDGEITKLGNNLDELINKKREDESKEKEEKEFKKTLRGSIMELPEDDYEKAWYNLYLAEEPVVDMSMSKEDIKSALDSSKFKTAGDFGATPELLRDLQTSIEETYKAYKFTNEMYMGSLNDFSDRVIDYTMVGYITSLGNECTNTITGLFSKDVNGKDVASLFKDIYYRVSQIDDIEPNSAKRMQYKQKQALNTFGKSEKLDIHVREALVSNVDGLWNYSANFVTGDKDWEVKTYVIQSLNHRFFNEYYTGKSGTSTLASVDGKAIEQKRALAFKVMDTLTERPLTNYELDHRESSKVINKQFEYLDKAYDISIICYFAAKKFLYSCNVFPYKYHYESEVLGALMHLTLLGMLMNGLNSNGAIELAYEIGSSIQSTTAKARTLWRIDTGAKIQSYKIENGKRKITIVTRGFSNEF